MLTLSPPPTLDPKWYRDHVAYTLAKFGMSLVTLGMAEEFRDRGRRVQRAVAAHGDRHGGGGDDPGAQRPRGSTCARRRSSPTPRTRSSRATRARCTGHFLIDEDVLREAGVTDFDRYAVEPGQPLLPDLFLG